MRMRSPARLALVIMLALTFAGCGGSSGGGSDPTDPVKSVIAAIEAKTFDKIADYACAAKKADVSKQFDFGAQMAGSLSGLPGVNTNDIVAAMSFKFENFSAKVQTSEGDKATVAITGTMKMSVDKQKMTDVLKAAGGDAASGMVDLVMSGFDQIAKDGVPMDSTVAVVKENVKWLICQ
jgi:hypothetical protein